MDSKKSSKKHKGFIEMEAKPRTIIIQTGRQTPPDALLWDLDFVQGISMEARRLATDFLGGGVASFVLITFNENADTAALSNAVHQHVQRLKKRGADDLVVLVGGEIRTEAKEVSFKDIRCHKQVSLKGKSLEEIQEILENALAEAK